MKIEVHNNSGKVVDSIDIDNNVFDVELNRAEFSDKVKRARPKNNPGCMMWVGDGLSSGRL